jgi:cysteinyl-tRNA synthetase
MSSLTLFNTLTRKKERFAPRVAGEVGLYVCGPTVYDYFHVGNARTFTVFDMVVRWLRATGYRVTYVRNVTDIDDKIIKRANENGESIEALTERMVGAFRRDYTRLGLLAPDQEPRATRRSISDTICGMWVETRGSTSGGRTPNMAMSRL